MYIVIQTLENNLISPFILGNSVNLNPLTCIVALLVFGPFMGLVGLIVAVPLTAIIMIILKHSERHKALANVLNY
jgi:predicted PurR-regulated permease PerM